ncbi:CPBP family intramembrane glutamic endopeptidase [Nocardioides sp. AE5]|uniref:CPBP family intramembrane glutamic endopeptidase n=1 Tax=Nocardioides sp. AE5 TaxID=2962573 RepID=UPI002882C01D|nr:CPBP family intramembrane glutamic endopeptidase [Nocardioides sp. AE5]MDT0201138.1 CPBP family intramembrane metalloprotease [Nocardioides sp. AE5]
MIGWLHNTLWHQVPRDHRDAPHVLRRRQVVCVVVVVLGAVLLGVALRIPPGDDAFLWSSLALSALWIAGGFASGPLHLGFVTDDERLVRPVVPAVALGLALAGIFCVGGLVVREIPWLGEQVRNVLEHGSQGAGPAVLVVAVLTGIAEEVFFRGAVYAAVPRRPLLVTTVAYVVATLATGNPMLVFAAVVLGLVVGLQRRASGGVLAPILTHVTWSVVLYFALPQIFGV